MKAIEICQLHKRYKGKKQTSVEALQSLSLSVSQGEVFGFLGPNGAGKSTTIKTLMGLIYPTSGSAKIMGEDVSSISARNNVGFLPENPAFYDYLTGEEYLHFVAQSFGMDKANIAKACNKVLEKLDLYIARTRPIRVYSKGMVQRLGLAQTLVHDPDVYIFDEPMSGLDPVGRALVKDIIKELKQNGKTVFFSTHITADVEAVCDRVGVLDKGKLLAVDSVSNILQRGIEGYSVCISKSDGSVEEHLVEKAELQIFIGKVLSDNCSIERVEPKRKDIEAFFLELVGSEPDNAL